VNRFWIISLIVLLVAFVLLDLFVAHHHEVFPWSTLPGFFSVFGFIGCLLLIGFSKLIGHYWLQKKEDYYERDDGDK
jgi:hypothetical protein